MALPPDVLSILAAVAIGLVIFALAAMIYVMRRLDESVAALRQLSTEMSLHRALKRMRADTDPEADKDMDPWDLD